MIPANEIPSIRIASAIANKATEKILFVVGGGLGDRVCAEPTIRYCFDTYPELEYSILTETPEIFPQKFRHIYTKIDQVPEDDYLPLYTYGQGLSNQFFNANLMNSVDFASISALRGQLPLKYRQPSIEVSGPSMDLMEIANNDRSVLIHLGRSWPSRTFPGWWWNQVISAVKERGFLPVLVGKNCVEVQGLPFFDLREKLSLNDFIYMCQASYAVITNDSSPIHLAATEQGRAKIAFVPTCRRGEFLMHYRFNLEGENPWGYQMAEFSVGEMWELFRSFPNNLELNDISQVPKNWTIEEFLPDPEEIADWL